MKVLVAWLAAAFLMFTALGYHLGVKSASEPYRIAAYIASKTELSLLNHSLEMRFHASDQRIIWAYNLEKGTGRFDIPENVLASLRSKTLSAESETLLTFVGGGALAIKAKDIVQIMLKAREGGDLRVKIATVVGGAVGFGIGYYYGVKSIDFSSPEVLSFLRDKKNVEMIKRVVYVSMLSKFDVHNQLRQDFDLVETACRDTKERLKCILESPLQRDSAERAAWRSALFGDAASKLSTNETPLDGYEFAAFFI